MTDTTVVTSVIDNIAANTLSYSLLLAAIGALSMAFIEMVKGVALIRRRFHRRQFTRWVADPESRREIIILATGDPQYQYVLFDQPVDRLLDQIQAAANLALEFPDRYPHAYAFFTKEDVETQAAMLKAKLPSDSQLWADFATRTDRAGDTSAENQKDSQEIDMRAAQQVRMRLANVMARRLDIFQNRTQYLWARGNQIASIVTGALLTAYALTRESTPSRVDDYVALFCLSLLAGMLAPFAKDVVSAVSGIR